MLKILQNKGLMILLIVVVGFSAYSFILSATFKTLDDASTIIYNTSIHDLSNIPQFFTESFFHLKAYYRPIPLLSYALEYHFFGLNPFFYYLNNIILHLLSAVVIYLLIYRLMKREVLAFFVSLLFALHPIHWVVVTNITGRTVLLAGFLFIVRYDRLFCGHQK